jgi:RHH-type proline utilization regulon transcriptional repressor/proline dehydrogenase/delta 1-pyrroline-5-carboxylate dehydrogenase
MESCRVDRRIADARARRFSEAELPGQAAALASDLLQEARTRESAAHRRHRHRLGALLNDPAARALVLGAIDRVIRQSSPQHAAAALRSIVSRSGTPAILSPAERAAVHLAATASTIAPSAVMDGVLRTLHRRGSRFIVAGDNASISRRIAERRADGAHLNFSVLGDPVLGEDKARRRMAFVLERLAHPEVEHFSIRLPAVFTQIDPLAHLDSLAAAEARLRDIFHAAIRSPAPGCRPKFVTLDVDAYQDLDLTLTAFERVLLEAEFLALPAGITLQAYLPDSLAALQRLLHWARGRVGLGGAPIRIRLVKGAGLAAERAAAQLRGWAPAPYPSKVEVDANFKRLLHVAADPGHARHARIGVATHNLFDVAYALLLRAWRGVEDQVEFEMLDGFLPVDADTVRRACGKLLLYTPIARPAGFHGAVAYIVRRLTENATDDTYLRAAPLLEPDHPRWKVEEQRFLESCRLRESVPSAPRRNQDRAREARHFPADAPFANEPDTDWSRPANRAWVWAHLDQRRTAAPEVIPLGTPAPLRATDRPQPGECHDPSCPGTLLARHEHASRHAVLEALTHAALAMPAWSARPLPERAGLLLRAAERLAARRGEIVACLVADCGKSVTEADIEVTLAVDLAAYYARSLDFASDLAGCTPRPLGPVVVAPAAAFPFGEPTGAVLGALLAGNPVLLKPAPESVLSSSLLARILWDAGIPREVLHFLPCPDDATARTLVADERVGLVLLVGSTAAARQFLRWNPALRLLARTSAKNTMVISDAADTDHAVRDLVRSAFTQAGQHPAATSLALVAASVHDHSTFLHQLRDAASSVGVGPAWQPGAFVTPLIRPPSGPLLRALTTLDPGESWLLEPRCDEHNPCLWSPGIKLGVAPGSWFHRTPCPGPVLGIMRVANLDEALRIQNESEFGLAGGLHSLDPDEIARWTEHVEVGSAFVNRAPAPGIARRQPFGGWKCSLAGPAAHVGGPNFVLRLARWTWSSLPARTTEPEPHVLRLLRQLEPLLDSAALRDIARAAAADYAHAWQREFQAVHDPSGLDCEWNEFRYRPLPGVLLRVSTDMTAADVLMSLLAAGTAATPLFISIAPAHPLAPRLIQIGGLRLVVESIAQFVDLLPMRAETLARVRTTPRPEPELLTAAAAIPFPVHDDPVLPHGRIELLQYVREQCISQTAHREGARLARS